MTTKERHLFRSECNSRHFSLSNWSKQIIKIIFPLPTIGLGIDINSILPNDKWGGSILYSRERFSFLKRGTQENPLTTTHPTSYVRFWLVSSSGRALLPSTSNQEGRDKMIMGLLHQAWHWPINLETTSHQTFQHKSRITGFNMEVAISRF